MQRSLNFVAELSPYFSSRYDVMDDPLQRQASDIRLDGRLGIESPNKHWALELIGKNLTDRQIIQIVAGTSLAPGTRYVTLLYYIASCKAQRATEQERFHAIANPQREC